MDLTIDSIRATVIIDLIHAEQTALNARLRRTEDTDERRVIIDRYRLLKDLYVDVNACMLRPADKAMITFEYTGEGSPRFVFANNQTIGRLRFTTKSCIFTPNSYGITQGYKYIKGADKRIVAEALRGES